MIMTVPSDHAARVARVHLSLDGLSIGDAFGDQFFGVALAEQMVALRALPRPPWHWTDDTQMAVSVAEQLELNGGIDPDALARAFVARFDKYRKYGPAMHGYFEQLQAGESWEAVAGGLFDGSGSFGNGAAMRVAPVGAYFADDLTQAIYHAERSARVTHAHPEGVAGAVAVAVAAALATHIQPGNLPTRREFLDAVLPHVPDSLVRAKIRQARDLGTGATVPFAVAVLGNGTGVSAQDTVPFALWCAGENLDNYEQAMWQTVSGWGDRDTTCAIVGGIVALSAPNTVPQVWREAREPLSPPSQMQAA